MKTKRETILELFDSEGFEELTEKEVRLINERLVSIYGRGGAASPAYIADILTSSGKRVRYEESLEEPEPDRYAEDFAGLLKFDTLAEAENSIRVIDRFFRRFRDEDDREGMERCRQIAERCRLRARLISTNDRVAPEKRSAKEEIAFWFSLWLQTPELFEDWIELRKCSPDYRRRFGGETREQDMENKIDE
jgi:hypothetical protein